LCTEVEYQEYIVQRLRSAYEAVEALYPTENNVALYQCPLIQQARALKLQEEELTKQKRELTRVEAEADMSAIVLYQAIVSIIIILILLINQNNSRIRSRDSRLPLALGRLPARGLASRDYFVGVPIPRMTHQQIRSTVPVRAQI